MPVFNPNLPSIPILPPTEDNPQPDREVDRTVLLDVAPDREDLLLSEKPIHEIKQALKLRIVSPDGHWLYRAQKLREVKLRNATTRFSAFDLAGLASSTSTPDEHGVNVKEPFPARRRVLSSSGSPIQVALSIETRLAGGSNRSSSTDSWGDLALSSPDTLVSPRPLGPTHILVIYSTTPFNTVTHSLVAARGGKSHTLRRKNNFNMTFPEIIEMPINDLLFLLGVPNIDARNHIDVPILPHRLQKELPKVLMRVPHLETFPELVVYLHTLNQADLFRKLIPEWMRDLIHPLLVLHTSVHTTSSSSSSTSSISSEDGNPVTRFFELVTGKDKDTSPREDCTEELINSTAKEIAEVALFTIEDTAETDNVVHTAAILDALRDNLNYIGYTDANLSHELGIYRTVLHRAVIWKGKMECDLPVTFDV